MDFRLIITPVTVGLGDNHTPCYRAFLPEVSYIALGTCKWKFLDLEDAA